METVVEMALDPRFRSLGCLSTVRLSSARHLQLEIPPTVLTCQASHPDRIEESSLGVVRFFAAMGGIGTLRMELYGGKLLSLVKTPRSRSTFRISNLPNRNIPLSSPKWLEDG